MRFLIAALAAVALAAPAVANNTKDHCEEYVANNGGGDASGCTCLGDKADSDSALADALAAITNPDELEAASDTTKEAIAACFPDSQES
jgi:hypothetical protein